MTEQAEQVVQIGGFIEDPAKAFEPAAAGGCCGNAPATSEASGCCGNAPAKASSCCDVAEAPAQQTEPKSDCCG